jgi:hypothetical protein
LKCGIISRIFPIRFCGAFQFAPVIKIRGKDRNADAFFGEQQFSNLPPRLTSLTQLADEFEVRFQDAAEWFSAAFSLCRFCHRWTGLAAREKFVSGAGES